MRFTHTGGAVVLLSALSIAAFGLAPSQHQIQQKTIAMPAYTMSGVPDLSNATANDYLPYVCQQGEYRWQPQAMPIRVCISDGSGTPGYKPLFQSYVRQAFNRWVEASGNKISWKEVKDPSQANINITWTSQVTLRPNGTEAGETNAYTKLDKNTGRGIIYGARMSLLTQLPQRKFSDQEMEKTILHETGHALGLQGHSPVATDIMYYAINAQQGTDLTPRDEATMQHLYADFQTPSTVAMKGR